MDAFRLMLVRKAKVVAQNQAQLTVTEAVNALCRKAVGNPTRLTNEGKAVPISIGSPAKGKAHFVLRCKTKNDKEVVLVMGDSHAVWEQHQTHGSGKAFVKACLAGLGPDQGTSLVCEAVELVAGGQVEGTGGDDGIEIAF